MDQFTALKITLDKVIVPMIEKFGVKFAVRGCATVEETVAATTEFDRLAARPDRSVDVLEVLLPNGERIMFLAVRPASMALGSGAQSLPAQPATPALTGTAS